MELAVLQVVVRTEVIVEDLEERERVPRVGRLLRQHRVHVHAEERPKDLRVLDEQIGKPGEGLNEKIPQMLTNSDVGKAILNFLV